jgi:molybdenum cofactor biosynthesis protein B
VGTRVVATRTIAGIAEDKPDDDGHERGVPVCCVPGSENAARLAVEEILVPEADHLVGLARRNVEESDGGDAEVYDAADADE